MMVYGQQIFRPTVCLAARLILWLAPHSAAVDTPTSATARAEELFAHRVLPIFRTKCFSCHGKVADDIRGEFNMLTREGLLKGGESEEPSIVPGKPQQSPLFKAVKRDGLKMPPKDNDRLTPEQIENVQDWIADGAPWPDEDRLQVILQTTADKWASNDGIVVSTSGGLSDVWTNRRYKPENLWAYQPLWKDDSGVLADESRHPIDVLIEERLEEVGIDPLPRADRLTLIRRLTFDLIGLPPTPAEIDSFLRDTSDDAFDRLVSRLLDSPHYGEQWGRHWLDVVRYADSAGFSNDFLRANAWRYRDYVVRSFNNDKPYDEFVREQIAGDEINPGDPESLIAVGFLRMGPWEHTAMSVAAVTRQQFLDDITNNVGVTFLAHELRCASCHYHKFDPIPTRDYYSMQAVFAPVQFADRTVEYQPYENIDGFAERKARIIRLQKAGGVKSLGGIPKDEWPVSERDADTERKGHAKVNRKRTQILERELKRFKPLAFSVYSGRDRSFISNRPIIAMPSPAQRKGEPPAVRILTGGSIESPSELVTPAVLSVVENAAPSFRIPETLTGRRAALAEWLTSPRNPLTARVMVNRVWQSHFGRGLAGNPNNFGATGRKPTHPRLLDFLADYFMANDWSIKKLHQLILSSQTWQRASGPVPAPARQKDPDNQLYSHFTPRRLSAEELRDSMLLVSGELNPKLGGLPVRPVINMEIAMQPRHIMGSVAPAWQPSRTPAERNRRSIYTERIRTLRDPMMEVFNQPGLDTSCERRDASTITPQAFTLLNSRNSFDRALAFASRVRNEANGNVEQQLSLAFRLAFGRSVTRKELIRCQSHYADMLRRHAKQTPTPTKLPRYVIREMVEEMTGLAFYWVEDLDLHQDHVPDLKPWDVSAEVRALADVCLVLLNSNEFIYLY
jgi:mono/diheme cytochrome c family protein